MTTQNLNARRPSNRVSPAALALVNTIMLTGALHAQSTNKPPISATSTNAPIKLPGVVVTGERDPVPYKPETLSSPKYTEPLRNITQTINVVPRAVFEAQGATTLSEALRNVAGITLLAGEGGGASSTAGDAFFMRGFDASNSIFVDGVRSQGLISRDTFNLEQIEVFKGPTGSDTGRATAAGYVNLSTKTPRLTPESSGSVGFGSQDRKRVTADLNQPMKLGKEGDWLYGSALRLNAMVEDGGVPGRYYAERGGWALAPSLGFGLGSDTRLYLSGQITEQNNVPDFGIPGTAIDGGINRNNWYGSATADFEEVAQYGFTGRIEHDFSENFTLRNQSVFTDTSRLAVITALGARAAANIAANDVPRLRQGNERVNRIFANQSSVTGKFETGKVEHSVNGGLEYMWERQFTPAITDVGTVANANYTAPNPFDPVAAYHPARRGDFTDGQTDTVALYAFETMKLTSKWQLNGGVRLERYQTAFVQANTSGGLTNRLEAAGQLFSYKAGVLYQPATNGSIYFSYSSTLTPPGSANFNLSSAAGNANNTTTDPQESENFEVGTKWDFLKNRLMVNAALFRTINKNEITADAANPGQFIYDRERIVQGIELGIAGQLTENWQALGNFSYLQSESSEADNAAVNGATLQWTPELSGSIWTTYRFPIGLTLGGGARYVGTVNRSLAVAVAGTNPQSPAYYVLDAMAQYDVNKHLTLRLNVYNLTDEFYPASLNNNGNRFNPGAPLSATLTASLKF